MCTCNWLGLAEHVLPVHNPNSTKMEHTFGAMARAIRSVHTLFGSLALAPTKILGAMVKFFTCLSSDPAGV